MFIFYFYVLKVGMNFNDKDINFCNGFCLGHLVFFFFKILVHFYFLKKILV